MEKQNKFVELSQTNRSLITDIYHFMIKRPAVNTFIKFKDPAEQKDYCQRILHRLNVRVNDFTVLNIHKIGINVPGKYVFEELLTWNNDSKFWPSRLAHLKLRNDSLDHVQIYLFGLENIFSFKPLHIRGVPLPQLFSLEKRKFNIEPHTMDFDNARSLLYDCSGGYPIGIFSLYVRSSIKEQNEHEKSQLFFMVAFDFFGLKQNFLIHLVRKIWQKIHNRVTTHVLHRIKLICEANFETMSGH